jgi:hypothetical protein
MTDLIREDEIATAASHTQDSKQSDWNEHAAAAEESSLPVPPVGQERPLDFNMHSFTLPPNPIVYDQNNQPNDTFPTLDPLSDPLSDPWNYGNWGVPGWFVTEFDEQNPMMDFGEGDTDMEQGEGATG